jgi:hypothetical protein
MTGNCLSEKSPLCKTKKLAARNLLRGAFILSFYTASGHCGLIQLSVERSAIYALADIT